MPFSHLADRVCLKGVGEDLRGFDAAFARFGRDYPPFDPARFGASSQLGRWASFRRGPFPLLTRSGPAGVRGRFVDA